MVVERRGLFVVVEGPDGSGKSSVVGEVSRLLAEGGHAGADVLRTAEPSTGPIGTRVRGMLGGEAVTLPPGALQALFYADRIEHVENVISPALAGGRLVLCDRYELSTAAYLAALEPRYRCSEPGCEWAGDVRPVDHPHRLLAWEDLLVEQVMAWHALLPVPDLTIVLSAPPDVLAERLAAREKGDAFEKRASLMKRTAALYAGPLLRHSAVVRRYEGMEVAEVDAARELGGVSREVFRLVRSALRRHKERLHGIRQAAASFSPVVGPVPTRHRNYIGVSGLIHRTEIEALAASAGPMPDRSLMCGVLMSDKTRRGQVNRYPARYPKRVAIPDLWHGDPRFLNILHYSTDGGSSLREELLDVLSSVGGGCHGIQLNTPWPAVADLQWLAKRRLERRILQIGSAALEMCGGDPKQVVAALGPRSHYLTDVLIDASGGKGKPLDLGFAKRLLTVLLEAFPRLLLGVAGGLTAETLPSLASLPGLPLLSIDTESGIRSGGESDLLDVSKMAAYVQAGKTLWGVTVKSPEGKKGAG